MKNSQELIGSKLAGLLEDVQQQHHSHDEATDLAFPAPVSPRSMQAAQHHAVRNRIVALAVHVVMAAAAAWGIPYGLWLALLSSSADSSSAGTVMILQPLLQVMVLHAASHASWQFAEHERWSTAKRTHVVMACRCAQAALHERRVGAACNAAAGTRLRSCACTPACSPSATSPSRAQQATRPIASFTISKAAVGQHLALRKVTACA